MLHGRRVLRRRTTGLRWAASRGEHQWLVSQVLRKPEGRGCVRARRRACGVSRRWGEWPIRVGGRVCFPGFSPDQSSWLQELSLKLEPTVNEAVPRAFALGARASYDARRLASLRSKWILTFLGGDPGVFAALDPRLLSYNRSAVLEVGCRLRRRR